MAEGPERIGLHNLKPAPGSRRPRKRIGRGEGSGTGKTAGRGQKGWGSRSGAKRRARFESGQEVTLEAMTAKGLATRKGIPVKVLAKGEISKPLTVHAHAFSKTAREKIEGAGGTCQLLDATERAAKES